MKTYFEKDSLCEKCPFLNKRDVDKRVGFKGSNNPDIYFVGLAPGREENLIGQPFVGDAGKFLDKAINYYRLENVRFGNVCCCYPGEDTKYETPLSDAIEICSSRVKSDISKTKPRIVVVLGDTAAKGLINVPKIFELNKVIHEILPIKINMEIFPCYYSYHPSFFVRRGSYVHEMELMPVKYFIDNSHEIFEMLINKELIKLQPTIKILTDFSSIKNFMEEKLFSKDLVAWDYETSGLSPYTFKGKKGHIRTVAFSYMDGSEVEAVSFPVDINSINGKKWNHTKEILDILKEWLRIKNTLKIAHNLSFELLWSRVILGLENFDNFHDTLALAWLKDEKAASNKKTNKLDFLVWKYFCTDNWKTIELSKGIGNEIDDKVLYYNARDAFETFRLFLFLYKFAYLDFSHKKGKIQRLPLYDEILLH